MEAKRVLVLGGDGFLGWPMALHLAKLGHQVGIVDNFWRRRIDQELGIESLVPISTMQARMAASGLEMDFWECSIHEKGSICGFALRDVFKHFPPDAVVHFAEQRSAPYSLRSEEHAVTTMQQNIIGTLRLAYAVRDVAPDCHIIKLGTMGEYGCPNIDIEEGYIEIHHKGRTDTLLFPKNPGSWYHATKCHDSLNLKKACDWWGLRVTDLNQGVVYNVGTPETDADPDLATRFDYDGEWGTCLNRFCVQAAVGHPLTVYGRGGQTRGYIDIKDTMRCIEAVLDDPAEPGEFKVLNQITSVWSVTELAEMVREIADAKFGLSVEIKPIENPRIEAEEHHYQPDYQKFVDRFIDRNWTPHQIQAGVEKTISVALAHKGRVKRDTILPTTMWRK